MKPTRILLTCTTVVAALFTVSATGAFARTVDLSMRLSPTQLHSKCDSIGGAYGQNDKYGSGACILKSGNVVTCGTDKKCDYSNGAPAIIHNPKHDGFLPVTGIHSANDDFRPHHDQASGFAGAGKSAAVSASPAMVHAFSN